MNYMATAEAVLRELGTAKEAKEAKEVPLNSLNSLLSHSKEGIRAPGWERGERQELDHLSTPVQLAIIANMVQTGAVLVLEDETGVTYRCHRDGVELPPDVDALPRYELTQPGRARKMPHERRTQAEAASLQRKEGTND